MSSENFENERPAETKKTLLGQSFEENPEMDKQLERKCNRSIGLLLETNSRPSNFRTFRILFELCLNTKL